MKSSDLTPPSTQATILLRVSHRGAPHAGLLVCHTCSRRPLHASSLDVYPSNRIALIFRSPRTTPPDLDPVRAASRSGRTAVSTDLSLSIHVGPLGCLRLLRRSSMAGHKVGRKDEVRSGDRRSTCQFGVVLS